MTTGAEGHVVDGRFELLERLGGGGMGLVWRARDLVLRRDVALKEVRPPDPELLRLRPDAAEMIRKRVLREAVSLARINHANVVTIHHIVSSAEVEHPWLVMELVPGGSFQDRLERGPCTPTETARLGRGVLAGLRAAHGAGILHRDVKPGNVLLRADGSPLLTDFGIAAIREAATVLTHTGELIGSPDYMAPERLRGHDDDPSSDLWSLAMMLYAAVEGHHPMRRSSTLATLAAILEEDVPPPRRAGALGPVLRSVLVKDVASRPDARLLDQLLAEAAGERQRTVLSVPSPAEPEPGARPAPSGEPAGAASPDGTGEATAPGPAGAPEPETEAPEVRTPDARTPGSAADAATDEAVPGTASPAPVRPTRGRSWRWLLVPTAVAALVVGLAFRQDVLLGGEDKPAAGQTPPSSPAAPSSPSPSPSRTAEENLMTPAGARKVVREIERVTGRTTVLSFTLDKTYASAQIPSKDGEVWNSFTYREGKGEKRDGGGRTHDRPTFDIARVNWDALPRLIHVAETDMGLEGGQVTQVIVSRRDGDVELAVPAKDAYGGAWLYADRNGKVLGQSPVS
ncbi:protein kinase [Streptomyces sp. S399]|uniref:protein kinase domain-containing protein n=1 Tax=Streptomyces sp. S399 TaxID=3096009 RepID=UPI002A80810A|nr:protein kinase [Streptomyces sp. S399]WPR52566.1 protein kinase [Streptomyces sp. S399]